MHPLTPDPAHPGIRKGNTHAPGAPGFPFADLQLARRLEQAEGRANRAFVEARAEVQPERGATWMQIAGALALYDGADSPLTQTFGLGLFDTATPVVLDRLEAFFTDRGADVDHETSPLADPALFALLADRGYRPVELTTVLYQPVPVARLHAGSSATGVHVRRIEPHEIDRWAAISAEGWGENPAIAGFMEDYGRVGARSRGTHAFLAETADGPIGAATLNIQDGVAILAGASTIPRGRRQGAQGALLDARLRHAADQRCELALIGASPGSGSQRNAERHGFRVAYTRIKWRLPAALGQHPGAGAR